MGGAKGIREPSVESDRESSDKDGGPEGKPGTRSPCVAVAAMVPQVAQSTNSLPAEDQPTKHSTADDTSGGGAPARSIPIPGHVAYLWQYYMDKRISGEATDLLLSSWRPKSVRSGLAGALNRVSIPFQDL